MPKKIIDFSNTIFYKIVCKDLTINELYVGHTTNFRQRKAQHKSACKNSNIQVYRFIRENGDWNNWDMIQIHTQSCINLNDAKSIERKYIETLFATLNGTMPGRTKNEWNEVHKDDINNYKSLWYKQNIDKIKEKKIEYNLKNSDAIKEYKSLYYHTNIDAIKEKASVYRELHKDETLEANNKYYAENKEAILASQAEYYQLNREKIIETVKTYAGNNKDKIADYQKEHYQRNKDKLQGKAKLYREANIEKIKESQRKTREKKKLLKQTLDEII